MLELYMRLFESPSVNFESRGSVHGIGRDEVLGAAAVATKKHPLAIGWCWPRWAINIRCQSWIVGRQPLSAG